MQSFNALCQGVSLDKGASVAAIAGFQQAVARGIPDQLYRSKHSLQEEVGVRVPRVVVCPNTNSSPRAMKFGQRLNELELRTE